MKIMPTILFFCCFLCFGEAQAQARFFNLESPRLKDAKEYGVVNVRAGNKTVIVHTIMAYGENVKGLSIQINNGFTFKLAPAPSGTILNYVGSSLNIVLQPNDIAKIEFADGGKVAGQKQIYVSAETTE